MKPEDENMIRLLRSLMSDLEKLEEQHETALGML